MYRILFLNDDVVVVVIVYYRRSLDPEDEIDTTTYWAILYNRMVTL
jgi:hypothetical protein